MTTAIDLEPFFNPEEIANAFKKYVDSKKDRYNPGKISVPIGADGITWEDFDRNLDRNAQNISRRVLNGSYRFYPFREIDIQKVGGGTRTLSVARIRDAIVQRQLYLALYQSSEEIFGQPGVDRVSFAYRKGKSAPQVARRIWKCIRNGYGYAFDADIKKFFDTLDHERLTSLIHSWLGEGTLAAELLYRYIHVDRIPYGSYPKKNWKDYFKSNKPIRERRLSGVPQGGVLSGLLANLYLNEFDRWVIEELSEKFEIKYFRYADDFVILTRTREDAEALFDYVPSKLLALCLKIHPEKTRISDIALGELNFVGFRFSNDKIGIRPASVIRFQERFKKALQQEMSIGVGVVNPYKRLRLVIRYVVNPRICGPKVFKCEKCGLPTEKNRSWIAFFARAATDKAQLQRLDKWMRGRVCKYFRDKYRIRLVH